MVCKILIHVFVDQMEHIITIASGRITKIDDCRMVAIVFLQCLHSCGISLPLYPWSGNSFHRHRHIRCWDTESVRSFRLLPHRSSDNAHPRYPPAHIVFLPVPCCRVPVPSAVGRFSPCATAPVHRAPAHRFLRFLFRGKSCRSMLTVPDSPAL